MNMEESKAITALPRKHFGSTLNLFLNHFVIDGMKHERSL